MHKGPTPQSDSPLLHHVHTAPPRRIAEQLHSPPLLLPELLPELLLELLQLPSALPLAMPLAPPLACSVSEEVRPPNSASQASAFLNTPLTA